MKKSRQAVFALLFLLRLVSSGTETKAQEKESAAEYDFGPVSYDVENLPPMENKRYALWDDKIYFRQYSDEDLEDGSLWAEFGAVPDTEKALMCMEPDGSVKQVGTDYGCESMFIVDGRIYSQRYSEDVDYGIGQVYSCELDGSDVKYYRSGSVLAVKGSKVICQLWSRGSYALSCIDAQTGREKVLTGRGVYYLSATEEEIFYEDSWKDEETGAEGMTLYSVDYEGKISELWTLTREEYLEIMDCDEFFYETPLSIDYFKIEGDMLYFSVGSRNGTAHVYSGGPIYRMKKDGSGCKLEAISWEPYFYLYDDGKNCAIYFRYSDEDYGKPVGDDGYLRQVTLRGNVPQNIIVRQPYESYDEFCVNVNGEKDSIVFYPDTSGICYVLLTEEECKSLSIMTHQGGRIYQTMKDIEYVDGKLFFTVFDLKYNGDKSIGWRDYYDRVHSACYCKDFKSGDIRLLYEYGE